MKQILYMAGEPIKHLGVAGRVLPLKPATEFNGIECEHIFVAAGRIEHKESLSFLFSEIFVVQLNFTTRRKKVSAEY